MAEKKKPTIGEGLKEGAQVAGDFVLGVGDALVETAKASDPPAEVAYYYLPEKNTLGAFYPGVPLTDLTVKQVEKMPKWVQKSLKHSEMYQAANSDEGEGGDK